MTKVSHRQAMATAPAPSFSEMLETMMSFDDKRDFESSQFQFEESLDGASYTKRRTILSSEEEPP